MSACRLHRRSIVGLQAGRLLIPVVEKNMLRSSLVVIATTMALASFARAQTPDPAPAIKPPSPEALRQSTGPLMDGMVPTTERLTSVVIEAQPAEAEVPGTAERIATLERYRFDALVSKGFARGQALQLTSNTPVAGGDAGAK
jgi:hypothetical protein